MALQPQYSVRVMKDTLVFSAAHFITYNGDICERLHGHNWRVEAAVDGPLDQNGYVFDFIALRDGLQSIVAELDHHVLLPMQHALIQVAISADGREVQAVFRERRWIFPHEDCVLLPVSNTTAELIAHWIAEKLLNQLNLSEHPGLKRLRISVEENFGQWADCWISIGNSAVVGSSGT